MFFIICGCSGVGAGVLDKVRVFRSGSGCSGVGAALLEWVRMFWIKCGCSGVCAGVLEWVRMFWSGCEICVLRGSYNKQRLFPYTALTD